MLKLYTKNLILKELKRWDGTESNRRHEDFQSSALPTELPSQIFQKKFRKRERISIIITK